MSFLSAGAALPFIGIQSTAGTVIDGTTAGQEAYKVLHVENEQDPGRLIDEGSIIEIGGGLFTASTPVVVGLVPTLSGSARLRLGTFPLHLLAAAFVKGTTTGVAPALLVHPFTPVTDQSQIIPITVGRQHATGFTVAQPDVIHSLLEIAMIPGQGVTYRYAGGGTTEVDGPATLTADPCDVIPSTPATVASTEFEFLGATGAKFLSLVTSIENLVVTDQVLGQLTSINRSLNAIRVRMRGEVLLTEEVYKQLGWGTNAAGVAVSTTLASGSFQARAVTPDNLGTTPAAAGYIDILASSMRYTFATSQRIVAGQSLRAAFLGIPTATPTISVANNVAGTVYS
jgi:hypothetical protein